MTNLYAYMRKFYENEIESTANLYITLAGWLCSEKKRLLFMFCVDMWKIIY